MKPNEGPDEFGNHPLDKFIANENLINIKKKISMNTAILDGFQVHPIDLFVTQNNPNNNISNGKKNKQITYQNYPQPTVDTRVNIPPSEITNINYVNPPIYSINKTNKKFSSNLIQMKPNILNLNMNVVANNNETSLLNYMGAVPLNKAINISNLKSYLNNSCIIPLPKKTPISKCNNILKSNEKISYNHRPLTLNYLGEIYCRKKTYKASLNP